MIWLEKKAKKFKKDTQYFNFVSKFSMSLFIGIIPATSFLLFLFWFLPIYLNEKKHLDNRRFFLVFGALHFFIVSINKTI